MNFSYIKDALSKTDIEKYQNLAKVFPENFYFLLAAKLVPKLPTLKKQPNTTYPAINILGNSVTYKSDSFNKVVLTINGTPITIEGLTPSVNWLKKLIFTVVEMEQENKVVINRPDGRTLVDDRNDARKQLNPYVSYDQRPNESNEEYSKRTAKYAAQKTHDEALEGTFFTQFYQGVVKGKTTSALKKNASNQPYYSVERFESAKAVNPSFKEDNFTLFDNGEVAFYVNNSIPVVDFTNAQHTYEGETRPITEQEATGYSDEWARIPEAVDFLEKYSKHGKGIMVYHDIVTYMDDSKVKQLNV